MLAHKELDCPRDVQLFLCSEQRHHVNLEDWGSPNFHSFRAILEVGADSALQRVNEELAAAEAIRKGKEELDAERAAEETKLVLERLAKEQENKAAEREAASSGFQKLFGLGPRSPIESYLV